MKNDNDIPAGFFDFNHDGEISFVEWVMNMDFLDEDQEAGNWRQYASEGLLYGVDPNSYETEAEYEEALQYAKSGWRDDAEDGSRYGVSPEDYETEDEYEDALEEAKLSWRDKYDWNDELVVDPDDYETEEEYLAALTAAKNAGRE